ncbi:MAG: hypothetical protein AB7L92_01580 [Alphaproteobacteria bacterium]
MAHKNLYIAAAGALGIIVALALFSHSQQTPKPAVQQPQAAKPQAEKAQSRHHPPLVKKAESSKKKRRKARGKRKMTLKRWNNMTPEQQNTYRRNNPKATLPPKPVSQPATTTAPSQ